MKALQKIVLIALVEINIVPVWKPKEKKDEQGEQKKSSVVERYSHIRYESEKGQPIGFRNKEIKSGNKTKHQGDKKHRS